MKTRALFLSISLFSLLVQSVNAASPAASKNPNANSQPVAASAENPEATLKPAMLSDVILKITGKPSEIRPMKAPDGKAEIWVYRRETNPREGRIQIGSTPIIISVQESDGIIRKYTVSEKAQFGDVHYFTAEMVELLMFNDQYVTQKVTRRELKRMQ